MLVFFFYIISLFIGIAPSISFIDYLFYFAAYLNEWFGQKGIEKISQMTADSEMRENVGVRSISSLTRTDRTSSSISI
jgi:hypothetical protein